MGVGVKGGLLGKMIFANVVSEGEEVGEGGGDETLVGRAKAEASPEEGVVGGDARACGREGETVPRGGK
jgi:hypothetical protein